VADAAVEGVSAVDGAEAEDLAEGVVVEIAVDVGVFEDSFDLAAEDEDAFGGISVEQRLDADGVAAEEENLFAAVLGAEAVHSVETGERAVPFALDPPEHDFSVAAGVEMSLAADHLGAECRVVEQFAVVNQ
jgi:hypothetical protein